jgi:putative protein kinase ArgK-like GTPase of G3E family
MNSLRQVGIHMQKNELEHFSHTISKIDSKWIKDQNTRAKAIKVLEEQQENLHDLGICTKNGSNKRKKLDKLGCNTMNTVKSSMVLYACDPTTQDAEAGETWVRGLLRIHTMTLY